MALSPGEKLGPYEILAPIGAGGMGEVYRAQDSRLRRTVAIKILPHDKLADSERKRRFLQEARAASALMHPNIVVVYDISSDERMDFLVMEYVRGETLKDRIKRGALPAADVMRFGAQISSALAAAHSAGIVHRDIKPANIMVTSQDSQIKVLDFGLAKLAEPVGAGAEGDTRTIAAATEPGIVMGTVAYMSPEQTRGEQLDGRSDIFSLGSVLYEAATGKQPFQGPSMLAVMHEIAAKKPAWPSEVNRDLPAEFDRVIERALTKDKNYRYSSAGEMLEALQALESRPVATVAATAAATVAAQPAKRRTWIIAAAVAVVVAASAGAVYEWSRVKSHVPDPQAYELYQRGRRDLQEFTEHGFKQSVVDFQNAIERDPEFAAAYAGLADAYSYQATFELAKPKDVMPLAESSATRAIEKDPQTAEAYTALGIVALSYNWDPALAKQRFERSLKIKPDDAFTQHFLGHYYESMGKWPEALQQMQRALDMDRLSPMYGEDMAFDLLVLGRNDEAVKQLRETVRLALDDPFAHALLAIALEATGKGAESLEQAQTALKLPGMFTIGGSLGGVFCRLNRCDLAQDILKQMEAAEQAGKYVAPVGIAMVHLALGDKAKGMARMREALNERGANISYNVTDKVFDLVREDPEFARLMDEMHLPRASWHDFPRYLTRDSK